MIPIFQVKTLNSRDHTGGSVKEERSTAQAMSSPLCSPSLGPSWTDTHLLEVLTSTGNTPLPPTPWHSLTSSSLKRCDILISQGTGCLSSQVDNSQNCTGCRSLLAQKRPHRPSLFYQGGNSLGRTNKGSARFSPSHAQS